jgi:hypothetical protein
MFPRMNIKSFSFVLAFYLALAQAHEGHSEEPGSSGATNYAQRHVRAPFTNSRCLGFKRGFIPTRWLLSIICMLGIIKPLHILICYDRDTFDPASFFQLHDLNRYAQQTVASRFLH